MHILIESTWALSPQLLPKLLKKKFNINLLGLHGSYWCEWLPVHMYLFLSDHLHPLASHLLCMDGCAPVCRHSGSSWHTFLHFSS